MYTLKLLLEDSTAQLDAFLFGPDAGAFLADLPPRDLRADPAAAAELLRRLNKLLGEGCQRCAQRQPVLLAASPPAGGGSRTQPALRLPAPCAGMVGPGWN